MAKGIDTRLSWLEAAVNELVADLDAPMIAALLRFIERQPAGDAAAFWRVVRHDYYPAEVDDGALARCGGTFGLQLGDRGVHARLAAEFYGDEGGEPAPDWPHPAPILELAQ